MPCSRPIKMSFDSKGNTTYRQVEMMPGLVPWEIPCRKCIDCRFSLPREKATRAMHEAKMHGDRNIFLTLTYNDDHLRSTDLSSLYIDFTTFIDSLRKKITRNITDSSLKKKLAISYMVTGEYGDKTKRPHWHALIFNYRPDDSKELYKSDRGDQVWRSEYLQSLWGKGNTEFGSVTQHSASYVARYALKKLAHGNDQDHDFHPFHKTSHGRPIGRSWIELYWKHTFYNGFIVNPDGSKGSIPRYYVDWLKKTHPEEYLHYVTNVRPGIQKIAEEKSRKEELEYMSQVWSLPHGFPNPISRAKVNQTILESKFKILTERQKL